MLYKLVFLGIIFTQQNHKACLNSTQTQVVIPLIDKLSFVNSFIYQTKMLFICPEPSVTKARVRTKSLKLGKAKKRRTDKSAYLFIHFVKTVFCQIRIQCLLLRPSHVLVISLVPLLILDDRWSYNSLNYLGAVTHS